MASGDQSAPGNGNGNGGCVYTHSDGRIIAHLPTGRDADFELQLHASGHDFRRVEHATLAKKRPPMDSVFRSDVIDQADGSQVSRTFFHTMAGDRYILTSSVSKPPATGDVGGTDVPLADAPAARTPKEDNL